jgi:hypothetical protein
MVPVSDAAAGRASGELAVHRQEPAATVTLRPPHPITSVLSSEEQSDEESAFFADLETNLLCSGRRQGRGRLCRYFLPHFC